ncbi:hypothetical protein [Parasporobacterium paucivorans]|uniref:Uncharacterized protein n=1 Tax=Parasporobacterium paucivorans DSM 15970 TaxID=1122934 RepID=A0A1M6JY96_9FIRM|nr:hypothetical protein [Parasporobacterium paucivorans]SHJ51612.1 hypothetical protein SAMN02745691_02084 [Parasporobacterium paucivorans DSM 15970]
MSRQRIAILGLVAFVAIAVNACQVSSIDTQTEKETILAEKESEIRDLIDKVDEYAVIGGEFTEIKNPVTPCKVFIVQNNFTPGVAQTPDEGYKYSPIYFELPEELQAKSAAELNTLVQLNIYEAVTGKYTNGDNAYTLHTEMTVIDMTKNEVIYFADIVQKPFTNITDDSQLHRQIPEYEIIARIEDLAGYIRE